MSEPKNIIDEGFNDDYKTPTEDMGELGMFVRIQPDKSILYYRRTQMGLTQQQVADLAKINIIQYQRLERGERNMSSCSMRIGMAICDVLKLDPHRFL